MNMSRLKYLRVGIAVLVFTALTALFLDFTETVPNDLHWLAHIQIVPAALGGGTLAAIFLAWVVVTLLYGRVYCSFVCPFGILQDFFSRISRTVRTLFRKKRGGYRYRSEMKKTRWTLLAVFLGAIFLFPAGVCLFDPYAHFGRIAVSLLRPLLLLGNNRLAEIRGPESGFYFQPVHVETHAAAVAATALVLVGVLALFSGRRYCNTLCPVGTLLGLLSRNSRFRVRLKPDCVSCGLCEKACKGECIDSKGKTVDGSRCVACFNCLGTCRRGSIVYGSPLPQDVSMKTVTGKSAKESPRNPPGNAATLPSPSGSARTGGGQGRRRSFLQWSAFSLILPAIAASVGVARRSIARSAPPPPDPSLPTGVSRVGYEMELPILPPGADCREVFQQRCTACHLCVAKCPANILLPSTTELGLSGFLQPVVRFDYGFCNYDCTICMEVCPSHALVPHTKPEKHRMQIGRVVFLKENCVVETQGTNCGACAEHCPTGAVAMVPFGPPDKSLTIPETDPELCVGCGACEHICPVRPYRAIYVDGVSRQGQAKPAYDPNAKQEEVQVEDFGF